MSLSWPTKHLPCRRSPRAQRCRARRTMTRSAKRSWRPRGAAGSSANMPSATAMPIPAWCSTRWRGSKKAWPPSGSRPPNPTTGLRKRWPRSGARSTKARAAAFAAVDSLALEEIAGADPQGHPGHQGDRLALARNRRRRPDLRSARFASRRHRRRLRTNRLGRPAGGLARRVRRHRRNSSRNRTAERVASPQAARSLAAATEAANGGRLRAHPLLLRSDELPPL